MSQQLEEQQDFGSQAVQGHEQKQERKGDTDAKEGGGTPPQAPPGPAPGIKKADAAAEALENFYEADDEDVAAESKKVVMALRALRPRASNYAKLKVSIEYKYQTHDVWAAIMQDIMDYEADLPPEWAALFRNDGGLGASRGTTQSTVKQQQPVQRNTQFMSVKTAPVMITKYNGKRGEARRWWKNARSILCDFTPNPTENDKLKWLAIIKQAMDLYETGRTRIRQLEKIHTTVSGLRDVEAIMKAFVNEQDANSLPQAIRKYRAMMQHEREPVRDFATRFQDMIDELHDFNYNTGDDQARFEEFKLKIKESTYVTEKGYTTMEAAVQAISLREQEQDRKFTSPKVPGIGNINAIKPQRDWYKDREAPRPVNTLRATTFGFHYLTFVDVATGKCWVKKIIKVNVAKKNKGLYKQRLTNCYRTWESELQAIPDEVSINKIPKKLHVDNETSLLQLPHPNIDASPVYYAQSNSKVERLHRTLANLSRINSTTPDKIQGLVNDTFTSGGGIKDKEREEGDDNDDDTESEDEKVPYDGRVLKEGQYVRAKVNLRSRNKQDPFWGGVAKVTERKGRKQYYIYDGNRVTLRHISHLKNYDIGEKLLEDVKVNPTVWERAMPCLGPRPKFDVEYGNNKVRVNDDWRMKIVYLGYPGLRNMERVAMKIKDGKYQLLYLAVPDLPFEHWYKVLGDLDAEGWYGHEPKDEGEFWVSDKGDKVREESITWWLVKFRKR
eukprot:jgi/Bigna1/86896/estExt_fgenesh1_pg.C_140242